MRRKTRKLFRQIRLVVRNTIGIILLLIGFIGIFLPILQGWLFILAGISVMKFAGKNKLIARIKYSRPLRPFSRQYDRWKARTRRRALKKIKKTEHRAIRRLKRIKKKIHHRRHV